MYTRPLVFAACLCMAFAACNAPGNFNSRGPIVLGDSATIVTETDPQYLGDKIPDFEPIVPTVATQLPAARDTGTAILDTPVAPAPVESTAAVSGEGLVVDFDEIQVLIPGIETTSFSHSASNKKSAAFMLTSGDLGASMLRFSGSGTVIRVTQRYQTALAIEGNPGNLLPLSSLAYTSGWQTLKLNNNVASLTGLEASKLQYVKASQSRIRSEVTKAARSMRMGRQVQQQYLDATRKVRSANKAPMKVTLRNVIWQISGKDSKGRTFNKELRIDMPG